MDLEYGLGIIRLNNLIKSNIIKIRIRGNFFIKNPNLNYSFTRTNKFIILKPIKKTTMINNNILFKYLGEIKILYCTVGKKSIRVNSNYIDEWNKLTTAWDDMTLEWDDYIMDLKINTNHKRLKYKEFNKNVIQSTSKTKVLY